MAGGFLHVAQRHASVKGTGDERVLQTMRRDPLSDTSLAGQPLESATPPQAVRSSVAGAIDQAVVALLLVSPAFLASVFITEQELPGLVERGLRLVPVLVLDCLWDMNPLFGQSTVGP
jgi:hypothetical protein